MVYWRFQPSITKGNIMPVYITLSRPQFYAVVGLLLGLYVLPFIMRIG